VAFYDFGNAVLPQQPHAVGEQMREVGTVSFNCLFHWSRLIAPWHLAIDPAIQPTFKVQLGQAADSFRFRQVLSMSVQELENAIRQLSREEFSRLAQWIDEYRAEQWDRQIEADILAGRLEEAGCRADADFDAGRCTPR
jgi:hypothetical protein